MKTQGNFAGSSKFWTGGLRNHIEGKTFDVWYDSADMLYFDGFPEDYRIPVAEEDISYGITLKRGTNNR